MRSSVKILVAAAATLLVAPQFAMADDVEDQLRLINERMGQLESQLQDTQGELQATQGELQATQDELQASTTAVAAQQELIEKAGLEREAQSGLSAFLSQTQFDGFVAASYNYNFNSPDTTQQEMGEGPLSSTLGDDGVNRGALGMTAPLHPNHNTFQVDQVWFGMRKPATAESRGGWAVDLVWGVGADNIGTPASIFTENESDAEDIATGDMPHLFQAYVEYLAPMGNILVRAGRFQTLVGAEVFRQDSNVNITRGLLWALQPKNHTGLTIGSDYDNGMTWTIGAANSYSATMADQDNDKTFIGQLGYRAETFSVLLNGLYGGNTGDPYWVGDRSFVLDGQGSDADSVALLDLVATWDPTESISAWINFDYYWFTNMGESPPFTLPYYNYDEMNIYGISTGARWGFAENTGLGVRFEWMRFEGHPWYFAGDTEPAFLGSFSQDANLFSLTGTLDHALTDNLTVKAEARFDWAQDNTSPDDFFITSRPDAGYPTWTRENQVMGLIEMLYRF